MKQIVLAIFIISAIAISWNSTKHGFGYTGSPTDGDDCTICHNGPATYKSGWVRPADTSDRFFAAGDTIKVFLEAQQNGVKNAGFELMAANHNDQRIGEFLIVDSIQTRLTSKGSITHTGNGHETTLGFRTWMVQYVVPNDAPDTIRLYASFNLNNGHFGNNDNTHLSNYTLYKNTLVSIQENESHKQLRIYPNPASDYIAIEEVFAYDAIKIYDIHGKLVLEETPKSKIHISNLIAGNYILHATKGNLVYQTRFVKF
jgi:hypothetical protein